MNSKQVQEAIQGVAKRETDQLRTCIPGVIKAYTNGRATVLPSGQMQYENGRVLDYPLIYDVPVIFPVGLSGKAGVTFPIQEGDGCLILFAQDNLQKYLHGTDTDDQRHHSLNDAICIPGLYSSEIPTVESNPDDVCISNGDSLVTLGSGGFSGKLSDGTTFSFSGSDLVVNGISLTKHTHPGVESGSANTGTPQG